MIKRFVATRKNQFKILFLAKATLIKKMTKIEREKTIKSLNIIKNFVDRVITNIVNIYSQLAFLNSSRMKKKKKFLFAHVKSYKNDFDLKNFLD